jgi:tetratricopeptide (TPR) repeat protein
VENITISKFSMHFLWLRQILTGLRLILFLTFDSSHRLNNLLTNCVILITHLECIMKYLLPTLLLASNLAFSQIPLPDLSPEAKLVETVGYTTFTIRYGRPAARARKIMGELVPYKKIWRTGAGKCTLIAFDQPVVINNKTVPAGAYALVTIPNELEWTVLLNSDTSKLYGDPSEYDQTTEAIAFNVVPSTSNRFYESMTISIDISKYDGVFFLGWENTEISFPIKTLSYERAASEITKSINANPNHPERLSQAAWFYYMNNDDPQQILTWLDTALQSGDERWILRQRFDILERMKNYDQAAKSAARAIAFLKATKPVSWEDDIRYYEEKMKQRKK